MSLFPALCLTPHVDDAHRRSEENDLLQKRSPLVMQQYASGDPVKKKVASVFLESFLFYSGFYLQMFWSSRAELINTADMIRLMIRGEAVHGRYIGYKFQRGLARLQPSDCWSACRRNRRMNLEFHQDRYMRSSSSVSSGRSE